jgi:hypothetical protein
MVAFNLRVAFEGLSIAIQTLKTRIEGDEEEEAEEQLGVAAILSLMMTMSPTSLDVPDAPTLNDVAAPPIAEST